MCDASCWQAELLCNDPEGLPNRFDLCFLQLLQDAGAKICVYVYDTHWVRCKTFTSLYLCIPLQLDACLARHVHVWLTAVILL